MPEVKTSAVVNAPAGLVWNVLADFPALGDWNPLIADIKGQLVAGGGATLVLRLGRDVPVPITFERVDPHRELRWRGGMAPVFVGSHYFKIERLDDRMCRVEHGERFDGVVPALAYPLMHKRVEATYQAATDALKRRAESLLTG